MLPARVAQQVEEALRGLRYGAVHLIIHEEQVVRIERIERIRLTGTPEAAWEHPGRPTTSTEVRHGVEQEG